MALNERLNRFKQHQERCQATLSSIATSQNSSTPKHQTTPTAKPSTPPKRAEYIRFSDDAERLQRINSVRTSPVGAQIKLVIELLYQALKDSGHIWWISNMKPHEDVMYPNGLRSAIKVDDELKKLLVDIKLPRDMVYIQKERRKNSEKPATDTVKQRAAAQAQGRRSKPKAKKKQRGITSRTKLTNAHLPELFR